MHTIPTVFERNAFMVRLWEWIGMHGIGSVWSIHHESAATNQRLVLLRTLPYVAGILLTYRSTVRIPEKCPLDKKKVVYCEGVDL